MLYSQVNLGLNPAFILKFVENAFITSLASFKICQQRHYYRQMSRLKTHLRVFLYALIFGMIAYGAVQAGIVLHRFLIS